MYGRPSQGTPLDEDFYAAVKRELEEKARRGVLVESSLKSSPRWWDRLFHRRKRSSS
jgi:hypothetical protein